jgi:hypothetical protein
VLWGANPPFIKVPAPFTASLALLGLVVGGWLGGILQIIFEEFGTLLGPEETPVRCCSLGWPPLACNV